MLGKPQVLLAREWVSRSSKSGTGTPVLDAGMSQALNSYLPPPFSLFVPRSSHRPTLGLFTTGSQGKGETGLEPLKVGVKVGSTWE